jgi:hypothetical protein
MVKKTFLPYFLFFAFYLPFAYAVETPNKFIHPAYIGVTGGYGSTTWDGLVPPKDKQGAATFLATPIDTYEGGAIWGFFVGYELIPSFALEASYTHYPRAKVFFDSMSLVAFQNKGLTEFNSSAESIALMGKFMVFIPHTDVRAFSSAGVARVHREDPLREGWHFGPTFGLGLNYNMSDCVMGEIGINYTSGYGQSEINPAMDYVPFLYAGFIRIAYRLG